MRWLASLAALAALALVACETPDVKFTYAISDDAAQSCGTTSCEDVKIPCDAVVSIRIVSPDDTIAPHVSICQELPKNQARNLCTLSQINLSDGPFELPKETLEVQIVIWPREAVLTPTGELDCGQYDVEFDAIGGFPISQQPSPAIGGHAFYHPGDTETTVTLGCTDLPSLGTCAIETSLSVSASVESFENLGVTVSVNEGIRYVVTVGEPKIEGAATVHSLNPANTRTLPLTVVGVVPIWRADIDLEFAQYACVQVLEDAAQATAAVTCSDEITPLNNMLEFESVSLPKETLDQILGALNITQFPPNGLTIGIVVDSLFNPVAGQTVMAPGGTVRYLSADRNSVGGTMTTTSGIFVSLDAPFGTRFSVAGSEDAIGGQIQGKVTVVVIKK